MKSGKTFFEILKGTWIFKRKISANGVVNGVAEFKQIKPEVLNYSENGVWQVSGQTINIYQKYQYHYDSQTDVISVYFAEEKPRFFYEINILPPDEKNSTDISATAEHQCQQDHYKAQYSILNKNQFSLFYYVSGPKKNYTIQTEFERKSSTL